MSWSPGWFGETKMNFEVKSTVHDDDDDPSSRLTKGLHDHENILQCHLYWSICTTFRGQKNIAGSCFSIFLAGLLWKVNGSTAHWYPIYDNSISTPFTPILLGLLCSVNKSDAFLGHFHPIILSPLWERLLSRRVVDQTNSCYITVSAFLITPFN